MREGKKEGGRERGREGGRDGRKEGPWSINANLMLQFNSFSIGLKHTDHVLLSSSSLKINLLRSQLTSTMVIQTEFFIA